MGSFISSDGKQGFFYIPEKLVIENANLAVKLNLQNKGETVESRRKKMYWSYSLLTISLMPTLFTYGNLNSTINRYNNGKESLSTVKNWQTGFYVSAGISIGCGIFFVYELVRYLMAANQVVPNKARFAYQSELEEETFQEPVIIQDEDSDSQNGLIINDEKKENEIIIVEE